MAVKAVSEAAEAILGADGDDTLDIKVYAHDVEKALKSLKRQLQKDGLFREIKQRSFYEKPSVKSKRKSREALKKRMKAQRMKRKD